MSARTAAKSTAAKSTASVHSHLDAAYAAYDSSAIARALLAAQAATGDWVARQRLAATV